MDSRIIYQLGMKLQICEQGYFGYITLMKLSKKSLAKLVSLSVFVKLICHITQKSINDNDIYTTQMSNL